MEKLIAWLEAHQLPCFYKHYFGLDCLGCGMQTAFILLLKGKYLESMRTYPALLPTFFLILFLILHLIFKFKKGAAILKLTFIITVSIMVISYVVHLSEKYFLQDY
jgi:hypothetical protein